MPGTQSNCSMCAPCSNGHNSTLECCSCPSHATPLWLHSFQLIMHSNDVAGRTGAWNGHGARRPAHDRHVPNAADADKPHKESFNTQPTQKPLGTLAAAGLACRVLGLARETLVASTFGLGHVTDAHCHAASLSTFLMASLGAPTGAVASTALGLPQG